MKITFLGAAETVTGSSYLVETEKYKFLVDCGMFQGPEVEERNFDSLEFDPQQIDFVILTHTHIDHSGLLPKLFKAGFRGEIYMTVPTSHLAEILLMDAAKIQENNYMNGEVGRLFRTRPKGYKKVISDLEEGMLYSTRDSLKAIESFKTVKLDTENNLREGLSVTLINAGHILGAASVLIKVDGKSILFSGDIGHKEQRLVRPFDTEKKIEADYVVMESLYGGITHQDRKEAEETLIDLINRTLKRNGNVMIPAFAVQRTQEILYLLKMAKKESLIQHNVQVYLDSPLAFKATKIYTASQNYLNDEVKQLHKNKDNPFSFPKLKIVHKHKQSLKISTAGPSVIIAGSGMANGGRILNHLASGLTNGKNTVIFVGYQAEETLGRELTEGAKQLKIGKKVVQVRAEIHKLFGFSAHGDDGDLLDFVGRLNKDKLKKIFLTHAEVERSENFSKELEEKGIESVVPEWKESFELK